MTLRHLAAVQTFRDNLGTEISANADSQFVPTSQKYAGTIVPTGYGTSVIPTG